MICRHCGKEYSDEFAYCPYCAEPKPVSNENWQTPKQVESNQYSILTIIISAIAFVGTIICCYGGYLFWVILMAFSDAVNDSQVSSLNKIGTLKFEIVCLIALAVSVLVIIIRILYYALRSERKTIIAQQFATNPTSICPECGSHSIKVYRKGYNYNKGFLLRLLNVKGGGYIAGIDSNTACCRCMNCGHDWETDYDYRLINK